MKILDYYKTHKDYNMINYYTGLECQLIINKDHIDTLHKDRIESEIIINDPNRSENEKNGQNIV